MINVTINDLLCHLKNNGYDASLQSETQQIVMVLNIENREYPLFVRLFEESGLIQLLAFMPAKIKPGTHADLARLLHMINRELDIPGFGMDENAEVSFYRCMLPTVDKKIDERTFDSFMKSIELICKSITPSVIAVSSGLISYGDVVRKKNEHAEQANP